MTGRVGGGSRAGRALRWMTVGVATVLAVGLGMVTPTHADDDGGGGSGSDLLCPNGINGTGCSHYFINRHGVQVPKGAGGGGLVVGGSEVKALSAVEVQVRSSVRLSPNRYAIRTTVLKTFESTTKPTRAQLVAKHHLAAASATAIMATVRRVYAAHTIYFDANGRKVSTRKPDGTVINILNARTGKTRAVVSTPTGTQAVTVWGTRHTTAAAARAETRETATKVKQMLVAARMSPQAAKEVAEAIAGASIGAVVGFGAGSMAGRDAGSFGEAMQKGAEAGGLAGGTAGAATTKSPAGAGAGALAGGAAGALGGAAQHLAEVLGGGDNGGGDGGGNPGGGDFADGAYAGGGGGPIGGGGDSCCHE